MAALSRRHFLLGTLGSSVVALSGALYSPAQASGAMVTVRDPDGMLVGVDPHTGDIVEAVVEPQRPRSASAFCEVHSEMPDAIEGAAAYHQDWGDVDAHLVLAGRGDDARWWYWRREVSTRMIDLPLDLQPAFATGACARWYHGAQVDAAHLGAGKLRLVAVDLATGVVALDRAFDRRLELAATSVSDNGDAVAHVQGGNTRLDLWLADLRVQGRERSLEVPIETVPVAPAAIDLRVFTDSDRAVLVAGTSWANARHPLPMVVILSVSEGDPVVTTMPGEILAISHNA